MKDSSSSSNKKRPNEAVQPTGTPRASKHHPPILEAKVLERQYIQGIKERRTLGDISVDLPEFGALGAYDWKVKWLGTRAELIEYPVPVLVGWKRKHTPERKEGRTMANEQNTKRARRAVHDLVNTNWTEYTKMVTLTYAETMLDYDRLALDWKHTIEALRRMGYRFPYLAITEHQTERGKKEGNDGSLHIHALLFTDEFIPFDDIKKAWSPRGSVYIEAMDDVQNAGAYVAKYITKEGSPPDRKSYRTSRDIKRPTFSAGLGDVLDAHVSIRANGYHYEGQYEYSTPEFTNQETGEVNEEKLVTVNIFKR